jgi:voltage-gated potassium channel
MARPLPLIHHPFIRRLAWYGRRIRQQLNPAVVVRVLAALLVIVSVAAVADMLLHPNISLDSFAASFYWALTSLLGNGDPGHATTALGGLVYVVLIVTGVLMLGLVTGAIIAVIIDFLLKEGQGLGASGFRNHIVICGWNATAREAIEELRSDDYKRRLVLIDDSDRNPAEGKVYFVKGDPTDTADLERADIAYAEAALVFPQSTANDADMRSILTVMAIESVAPHVRTVAEVNNPRMVEHFMQAHADEVLVTPLLASHLLARSALYPGLSDLVTDMVSGGEGSELYRVFLPSEYLGMNVDDAGRQLRDDHRATLLALVRDGKTIVNPEPDFVLADGDQALVVATQLGKLKPVRAENVKK